MCRISTCTQVFFTFYHLKYLQVFQSSINSKSPDSQQKVALLSISMLGCFLTLGWHPVRNFIQFLFFFFQRPNKKKEQKSNPSPKRNKDVKLKSLNPYDASGFYIPPSLLSLRSFTLVDINFHTNPFSYKSSAQQKMDMFFFRTKKQKTAPTQKKKWTNKKISPPAGAPRLHWHLRYWCQWGFRIRPQSFPECKKIPSWNERLAHENMVFFPKRRPDLFFLCQHFFSGASCQFQGVYLSSIISFDEFRCEDRLGGGFYPATTIKDSLKLHLHTQRSDRMMDNALIWGNS